jgi:hypothetical protein
MKRTTCLGAVALLTMTVATVGCGGGGGPARVETDWVLNENHALDPGVAACVEGPYAIPDGANIVFDIDDAYGDDMDASVVATTQPCDGSYGYGKVVAPNWYGILTGETQALPAGYYDLAVTCYNQVYPCSFTVRTFGYLY